MMMAGIRIIVVSLGGKICSRIKIRRGLGCGGGGLGDQRRKQKAAETEKQWVRFMNKSSGKKYQRAPYCINVGV